MGVGRHTQESRHDNTGESKTSEEHANESLPNNQDVIGEGVTNLRVEKPSGVWNENERTSDNSEISMSASEMQVVDPAVSNMAVANIKGNPQVPDHCLRAEYVLLGSGIAVFTAMKTILGLDSNADILILEKGIGSSHIQPPPEERYQPEHDLALADATKLRDIEEYLRR